jgi:hypothetical protein
LTVTTYEKERGNVRVGKEGKDRVGKKGREETPA